MLRCIVCHRPLRGRLTRLRRYCSTACRRRSEAARLQVKRAAARDSTPTFTEAVLQPFDWSTCKPFVCEPYSFE